MDKTLLQCLVDLDVASENLGQEFRKLYALLFGLSGKLFPYSALNGGGQENFGPRTDVMNTPHSIGKVDLKGQVLIMQW